MRILLVGDNNFPGDDVQRMLCEFGAEIAGPAHNADQAIGLLDDSRVDGAILDLHLDAEAAFQVADALMTRKIPFIFASTYARELLPGRFQGYHLVAEVEDIGQIIVALFGQPH